MMLNDDQNTLLHSLFYWESVEPNKVYLSQPLSNGQVIDYSWAEVASQVRCIATHLKSLKLEKGSTIAILGKNCAHWVMADLAIWLAGHISVPIYPTLQLEGVKYILDHSEAKLMFVGKLDDEYCFDSQGSFASDLIKISLPLSKQKSIPSWSEIVTSTIEQEAFELPSIRDIATIIYTSGSTGKPKGVVHSFETMMKVANNINKMMGGDYKVSKVDRVISYLPLAHAAERSMVEVTSLVHGFQVFFNHNLASFPTDLKRAAPTIFFSVPRLWTKFYQAIDAKIPVKYHAVLFKIPLIGNLIRRKILKQLGLHQVKFAITGSAPLPAKIISWYHSLELELLDCYGMTENFAYSHVSRIGQTKVGYVGQCTPDTECRIDENGEILIKSPGQMLGYHKDETTTKMQITADGFFRTGDQGEIDSQGRLKIIGRTKDLFKTSKGKYVAPAPIENKLQQHPKIEAVCVVGENQPQPYGLVMISQEAQKNNTQLAGELESLLESVNESLDSHEKLDCLVIISDEWNVDNGFLTPTLKIKRNIIEQFYSSNGDHWLASPNKVMWESS